MTLIEASADICHRILAPRIGYLIGTQGERGANLAPISNVTQVSAKPQVILVAVSRRWETYKNLQAAGGFTLSVPRAEHAEAVWRLGNKFSGLEVPSGLPKLSASGASIDYSVSRYGPTLADATGWFECEIAREVEDAEYDHGIFFGRVTHGAFNSAFMSSDGNYSRNSTPLMQVVLNTFATSTEHWQMPWLGPNHP